VDATKVRVDATKVRVDATKVRVDATKVRVDAIKGAVQETCVYTVALLREGLLLRSHAGITTNLPDMI
ncbi:MAG: hypothetical protein V7K26_07720, partial [Nostoc sp.]